MQCPIVDLTKQLISCPSISPNDFGCQEILIQRLQNLNFQIKTLNIGNIKNFWATHGHGETFCFAGHTDVVSPGEEKLWVHDPFIPIIKDNKIFGRGAADMKGAIAAMLIATENFIKKNPKHNKRLAFLITSDEEESGENGTAKLVDYLISKNECIKYCLIGEPTSNEILGDVIKNGRRGSITANLIIHGIQGHIAYPDFAKNPIHHTIPFLNQLINVKWDQGNDFFPPTVMQISNIISGNGNSNLIPGDCLIQFNFRFNNMLTENIIRDKVEKLLNFYKLSYSIKWKCSGQPFITLPGTLVDIVMNVITKFNFIKPRLMTDGGTSDGRFISKICSQIVELGLLNSTIHKVNENIKISDLKLLNVIYQNILETIML